MTKSRTLRKAAAVALSLAMAFSVAGTTTANAAAKPSLKKTKVTVKVKKSVKVGIKNAKLVKKLTVKSKNSKVAKAAAVGKKAVKITGKKAGKTKVTVTIKYKSGKKTKTLKKNITVKVAKASTDDDGTTVTQSLKLIDLDGLQSDNTAIASDRIQVAISGQVGTIDRINWYVDDKLVATSGAKGDDSQFVPADNNIAEGKLVARVVTTAKTTYESDAITISKDTLRATVSDLAFEDNYEDNDVALAKADNKLIASLKVSKAYVGTIKLVKAGSDGKPSKDVVATRTVNPAWAVINAASQYSNGAEKDVFTNYAAKAVSNHALTHDKHTMATYDATGKRTANAKQASALLNADGSVSFKFVVNSDIDRGTKLFAIYDEDDCQDDDEKSATPNANDAAVEVPFVKVPAKLVVNPVSQSDKVKIAFQGENGSAAGYINNTDVVSGVKTLAGAGVKSVKLYNDKDKTVSAKDSSEAKDAQDSIELEKGVVKTGHLPSTTKDKAWYLATAELDKAVYGGAANQTLTSEAVNTNADIAEKVEVKEAAKAEDATVTFTNLNADATVYFVRGSAKYDDTKKAWTYTSAQAAAEALDPSKATNGVDVEKGAKEVTIPDALKDKVFNYKAGTNGLDPAADKGQLANEFAVVIVPKDGANFGKIVSPTTKLVQKITKFALVSNVTYNGIYGSTNKTDIDSPNGVYDNVFAFSATNSSYVVGATDAGGKYLGVNKNALQVKDQFGDDIFTTDGNDGAGKAIARQLTFRRVGGNDIVNEKIKMAVSAYHGKDDQILTTANNGVTLTFTDEGADITGEKDGVTFTAVDEDTKQTFTLTVYKRTATDKKVDASDKANYEAAGAKTYLKLTLA